jgi:hypothetical protein
MLKALKDRYELAQKQVKKVEYDYSRTRDKNGIIGLGRIYSNE